MTVSLLALGAIVFILMNTMPLMAVTLSVGVSATAASVIAASWGISRSLMKDYVCLNARAIEVRHMGRTRRVEFDAIRAVLPMDSSLSGGKLAGTRIMLGHFRMIEVPPSLILFSQLEPMLRSMIAPADVNGESALSPGVSTITRGTQRSVLVVAAILVTAAIGGLLAVALIDPSNPQGWAFAGKGILALIVMTGMAIAGACKGFRVKANRG